MKPLRDDQEDHEKRIRHLERYVWVAIGLVTALQVLPSITQFIGTLTSR